VPSPSRRQLVLVALAAVGAVLAAGLAGVVRSGGDDGTALTSPPPSPRTGDPQPAAPAPPTATTPVPFVPVQDAAVGAQPVPDVLAPVSLTLPTLGVEVPVDPVGVDDDGQMEIPPLAERAGWYRFGPAPGSDEGAAVIAAHVDSVASAGLGPFAKLRDLDPGDQAVVQLADGATVTYTVREVTSSPKTDVTWPDVFVRDGPPELVLITCGGRWVPQIRHYSDNVIVYLSPVGS
jgi:hypothetical protein